MAYYKKYYKNIVSCGHSWTLEIHQDAQHPVEAQEIGAVLQGLRLYVQGDQADVDTPIVKTSLEMVFVDAPDLEQSRKCGNWEEFYTPNATEYKVLLYKDGILEWTGYVTPDSFSEDIMYRGSVTIIARDNLGTLQDYEYNFLDDGSDKVTLRQLIDKAMETVVFPMLVQTDDTGSRSKAYAVDSFDEQALESVVFNHSSFLGKTWLEVLEATLYSTGLTLRYVGGNGFMLAPLRDIPLYGFQYWADVPVKPVSFLSYGHRELSPSVKYIKGVISYEILENALSVDIPAEAYGEKKDYIYRQEMDVQFEETEDGGRVVIPSTYYDMPVYALKKGCWSTPAVEYSLFLNPFAYGLKEGFTSSEYGDIRATDAVYLATNAVKEKKDDLLYDHLNQDERTVSYKVKIGAGKYQFSFMTDHAVTLFDNFTKIGFTSIYLHEIRYNLRFIADDLSVVLEYNKTTNQWESGYRYDSNIDGYITESQHKFEFPELEVNCVGVLELEIKLIRGTRTAYDIEKNNGIGAYVRIKNLELKDLTLFSNPIESKSTIVTKYNESNNLRLERNPSYGFNMQNISTPSVIKNGMFLKTADGWYKSAEGWVFNAGATPNPLGVLIHQQILAYNAKPNNVLTGELATPNPTFNALYDWRGTKHLLMSGALNILTGRMEGAVLREFMRYDQMWETWLEQDVLRVNYETGTVIATLHSNKDLTRDNVEGVPTNWMYATIKKTEGNAYELSLRYDWNYTDTDRVVEITIDGAALKFIQSHYIYEEYIKDYNADYNEDYL